ncbi:hypothetical protein NECID01_0164 [Nematocida sp. AWRm77]|nr:hypothetical protein NECID01_0164 [Nematocida sp. AWRm77]
MSDSAIYSKGGSVSSEGAGELLFLHTEDTSILLQSGEDTVAIALDGVEYIEYAKDRVSIGHVHGRVPSTCWSGEAGIEKIKNEIEKAVGRWARAQTDVFCIDRLVSMSYPDRKTAEWAVKRGVMEKAERLFQENRKEECYQLLVSAGGLSTSVMIEAFLGHVPLVSQVFGLPLEKTVGIEKYIEGSTGERSKKLQWLKTHFYKSVARTHRVPDLDHMIAIAQAKVLSLVLEQEISPYLSTEEMRSIFVQLSETNKLGLQAFVQIVTTEDLMGRTRSMATPAEQHILWMFAKHLPEEFLCAVSEDGPLVQNMCMKFNQCIEKEEGESVFYLGGMLEVLLTSAYLPASLQMPGVYPVLFERPGMPEFRSVCRWRAYAAEHVFTLTHLKLVLASLVQLSVHMKAYLIFSGAIISIAQVFGTGHGAARITAGKILSALLLSGDRVLRKYLQEVNLAGSVSRAVTDILFGEPSAVYSLARSMQRELFESPAHIKHSSV